VGVQSVYREKEGGKVEEEKSERRVKEAYVPPKVLATYSKEELKEAIRPHGSGGGCGCGTGA